MLCLSPLSVRSICGSPSAFGAVGLPGPAFVTALLSFIPGPSKNSSFGPGMAADDRLPLPSVGRGENS